MGGADQFESDSDLGESSVDEDNFNRGDSPSPREDGEINSQGEDGEQREINADLEAVESEGEIGVIIPAPDRETNNNNILDSEHAVVPEEAAGEDEDPEDANEEAQVPGQAKH